MTDQRKQKIKNALNAGLSAAVGGAALAVCGAIPDPPHADLRHLWPVMVGGAIYGLAQHYRQQPTIRTQQALLLQSTPAGQVAQAENAVIGAVAAKVEAVAEKVKDSSSKGE